MQLSRFVALVSISLSGVLAVPGLYSTPTSVGWPSTSCATSCATYCTTFSSTPTPTPTASISIVNQKNICQSGSPFCCALSSTNDANGHSCNQMDNSTINCDSTVVCCNDNGSGTQICTNSLTIVIPVDLSGLLGNS